MYFGEVLFCGEGGKADTDTGKFFGILWERKGLFHYGREKKNRWRELFGALRVRQAPDRTAEKAGAVLLSLFVRIY